MGMLHMGSRRSGRVLACFVAAMALVWATAATSAQDLDQWIRVEGETARRKLLGNIGANGAVIASPAEYTPVQNYYFHWVRDGALTMDVVVSLYLDGNEPDKSRYLDLLKAYIAFSLLNQTLPQPPRDPPLTGLGEPKLEITGRVFDKRWGRPQNDGPDLRAVTLIRLARALQAASVPLPERTENLIRTDLDYVAGHWADASCDLWEEVDGHHFYTRIVQRRALVDGAAFHRSLGRTADADRYAELAEKIEAALQQHVRQDGALRATQGNDRLDVSVILGVLHADAPSDPCFPPADAKVLKTAWLLRSGFRQEYPINQRDTDEAGKRIEPGIGRYPGDKYDGANNKGGNPWFLTTAGFAELCYRVANRWQQAAQPIKIDAANHEFLNHAIHTVAPAVSLAPGQSLDAADQDFAKLIAGLRELGDRYLRRIRLHAARDGSLSEQFNRYTGFMTSAPDLIWSYASLTSAMRQRSAR